MDHTEMHYQGRGPGGEVEERWMEGDEWHD